jgi:hypothetical protein
MLPSRRWRELVQYLLNSADVILFDGPAALCGPDAALLAPHVDGVVLALSPTTDSRDDVAKTKTRLLHQKGTRLLGAVTFIPVPQSPWPWSVRQLQAPEMPQLVAGQPSTHSKPQVGTPPSNGNSTVIITPAAKDHWPSAEPPLTPSPAPPRPPRRPNRPAGYRRPRRTSQMNQQPDSSNNGADNDV